jgi:hypothetical protein
MVVDEQTGAPVAGARVTVTAAGAGFDDRSGPSFVVETYAGNDGRFEIAGIPAGEFIVTADPGEFRASHLHVVLGDEGAGPFLGKPSLSLRPGEVKDDIKIVLPRALAIEGRLIDEYGDAMAGVAVTARAVAERSFAARVVTDDRGRFRLYGLRSGEYAVCADPPRPWITRGERVPEGVSTRYEQTCVNGISLTKTGVTPSVQLQAQRVAVATVTGTLVSSTGGDVRNGNVTLFQVGPDGIKSDVSAEIRDGQFVARGLVPGEYLLQATLEDRPHDRLELREMASLVFTVDGSDIEGLTVTTSPGATISGRIERDPRATAPLPSRVMPRMMPPLDRMRYANYRSPSTVLGENGTFTVKDIFGPKVVAITDLPKEWFVAAVRHGDDDITGQVREFAREDKRPVVIVLSNRSATLRARAIGPDGKLAPDGVVVVLPADPRRWNAMPYFDEPALDKEGFVTMPGRAPGDYIAAAVTLEDLMGLIAQGATLEPIARAGRRITLVEGETLTIEVPLSRSGSTR